MSRSEPRDNDDSVVSLPPETSGGVQSGGFGRQIIVLSCIAGVLALGNSLVLPVIPSFGAAFGAGGALIGVLVSGFAIGRLLTNPASGVLSDRLGGRGVGVTGCFVAMTGALLTGLAPTMLVAIIGRILQGVGSALFTTPAQTTVLSLAGPERMGRAMSFFQATLLTGFATGPTFGGLAAGVWGLRAPFYLFGAVAGIGGLLSIPLLRGRGDRTQPTEPVSLRGLVRVLDPTVRDALASAVCTFGIRNGVRNTLVPLFAVLAFQFSEGSVGMMMSAATVANVLIMRHVGRSLDRRGRRPVLLAGLITSAVTILLFAVAPAGWAVVTLLCVLGITTAYPAVGTAVMVADVADEGNRSSLIALQRTGMDLGLLIGPILAGIAVDLVGLRLAFVVIAVIVAAITFAVRNVRETRTTSAEPSLNASSAVA